MSFQEINTADAATEGEDFQLFVRIDVGGPMHLGSVGCAFVGPFTDPNDYKVHVPVPFQELVTKAQIAVLGGDFFCVHCGNVGNFEFPFVQ